MPLMSAKDYLSGKGSPSNDSTDSVNNSPSQKSPSKGLMSAADFLKNKQMNHVSPDMSQDDIMTSQHKVEKSVGFTPKPTSNDMSVLSTAQLAHPELSPFMQQIDKNNNNQIKPLWNGLLDNPIIHGAETAFDYGIAKPLQTIGAGIADISGAVNNLLTKPQQGYNDEPIQPSKSSNFSKDFANIWSGNGAEVAHNAMEGAFPNDYLRNLPGTNVSLGNIEEFLSQNAPLGEVGPILKVTKFAGTKLGDAISGFLGRGKSLETPSIQPDQHILGLPEPRSAQRLRDAQQSSILEPNTSPIYGQGNIYNPEPLGLPQGNYTPPKILKPLGAQDSFANVMEKVIPQATERMTPPLENPNELAKWVQGHLNNAGHDVSLNEVRQLNYEDLRQLADEMRPRLKPADVVRQTAHDMGYGKIFDETSPSIKERIAADAQSRVYGVPAPRVNIAKPDFNIIHNADAAMPETKIGFTKPSLLDMANKPMDSIGGKSLNADTANSGLTPRNVKTPPPIDKALNADAKLPQPIRLTDKQVAKNARTDNFAREETNPILPNTASQIQSKTIKEPTSLRQKMDQAYINTVDNVYSLSKFDKSAKDANGGTLNPSDSAYKLALNSRNADMQARQILEHNMIDSQGNVVGDSLMDVAKQIPAKDLKAFEDYQVAKHAITRMERGEKVYNDNMNMTVQKAKMIVDNYEKSNPEFKTVNEQYQNFDEQLGQHWLVDTGMLKPEQWNGYREANPNYTPNNRIFSDLEKNNKFGSKGGFTDQSQPIKTADGSQRPIVSPLESRIEHVATYVKTAKQNEVGQAVVRSLQDNPEALKGFAEIVHDQPHVNVDEMLQKDGPEGLMNHIAQTIENAKQKPDLTKGNIVNVLMNGEVVHLRIHDPQFLEAVGNLSPEAQPKWVETVGKVTHVMKTTTTGVNPIFGLTKNIWKDIPHAYVASKSTNNPFVFGKDILSALADVIGNKESYQAYKNMGGGHSSSLSADRNLLAQSKEKLVPSTGIGQTLKRNLITKPYHALENFNNAIETAPRLAEYNRIVKQGGGTYDAKVEGLHQANDLTTNFNKRGNDVKALDNLVPYLNASVQGLDQFARMFKTNPVATTVKAAMAISVPTAILYAINHDDPNYQQMSNYIKDNNFLIPKGDGTFFKIPKPRELGMLFSSSIERVMRQHFNDDPKAFQDFASNLVQNFTPPLVGGAIQGIKDNGITGAPLGAFRDSIAGPMINLGLNKDFVNRPIVPKDLASLSPRLQVDPKTSEPAKFLGNLINASPKQLDYLAKSYLGGISSLGIPATTQGNGGNFLDRIGNTLKQQVTADPLYSNDISKNFYDAKAQADQAKKDATHTGIPLQSDLSTYYTRVSNSIIPLRQQEKLIQNDKSLSSSDKQAKLRDIQTTMNSILQKSLIK